MSPNREPGEVGEQFRRTVSCSNGHSFTTDTAGTWNHMYCPGDGDGWHCLKPLLDSPDHLIADLRDLLADLRDLLD